MPVPSAPAPATANSAETSRVADQVPDGRIVTNATVWTVGAGVTIVASGGATTSGACATGARSRAGTFTTARRARPATSIVVRQDR